MAGHSSSSIVLGLLFAAAYTLTTAIPEEVCETCEDTSSTDHPRASVMLQVNAMSAKDGPLALAAEDSASAPGAPASDSQQSSRCWGAAAEEAHLEETRECLPSFLQEAHLSAIRVHAARLVRKASSKPDSPKAQELLEEEAQEDSEGVATFTFPPSIENGARRRRSDETTEAPEEPTTPAPAETSEPNTPATEAPEAPEPEAAPTMTGTTATLDASGFKQITSLCCPPEMEAFFNRLLASEGFDVCSKPHVQGLMHWFTCVPDMRFQYMTDVVANGNPCKYWTKTGTTCPAVSDQCAGKFCR